MKFKEEKDLLMWMYLGLLAALFLGFHNLCKKQAVQNNEVLPVVAISTAAGVLIFLPLLLGSMYKPEYFKTMNFYIDDLPLKTHGFIFIKSMIMAGSWLLAYEALKYLPITIVAPIRSTGPFFTFIGAIFIYNEQPNLLQWIGFFLIIFSVVLYSKIGKKEGIIFKKNKWIFAIVGATFLGASSGLYDKFLVQSLNLNPQTLLFWFCFYTLIILVIILSFIWFPFKEKRMNFKWRWTIPMIGILLYTADYFYFKALQDPEALIMLLSAIKRSQLLIAVLVGGFIFKEKNKRKKMIPLIGIMLGVFLILYV